MAATIGATPVVIVGLNVERKNKMIVASEIPVAVRVESRGEDEVLVPPKQGEVVGLPSEEETEAADMTDAIAMLQQSRIIMSCLADHDLTPKLLKNHRECLERLVGKIEKFLEDIEDYYEDAD